MERGCRGKNGLVWSPSHKLNSHKVGDFLVGLASTILIKMSKIRKMRRFTTTLKRMKWRKKENEKRGCRYVQAKEKKEHAKIEKNTQD